MIGQIAIVFCTEALTVTVVAEIGNAIRNELKKRVKKKKKKEGNNDDVVVEKLTVIDKTTTCRTSELISMIVRNIQYRYNNNITNNNK